MLLDISLNDALILLPEGGHTKTSNTNIFKWELAELIELHNNSAHKSNA